MLLLGNSLRDLKLNSLKGAAIAVAVALVWLTAVGLSSPPASAGIARMMKAAKPTGPKCVSVADAVQAPNQDVCVNLHIYEVVTLADGTRFLDVCPVDVADDACRFTVVSLREDREKVGDLTRYRDQDVKVRGIVRATHGRMGIVLSHMRQFDGGPEKFRPNPRLLRGFNGESERLPVRDPNLAGTGRHRSFMNTRDKEEVPKKQ